jgi:hypothetical protein
MPTETAVRKSLGKATSDARRWFNAASIPKDRSIYFAHGKLGDNGKGAVYAYFDKHQATLLRWSSEAPHHTAHARRVIETQTRRMVEILGDGSIRPVRGPN